MMKFNKIKLKLRQNQADSFYDFIIDEKSLFDRFKFSDKSIVEGLVGCFGSVFSSDKEKRIAKQFLGLEKNPDLESGRIPLFVCCICGDMGCGAITFELIETETEIIWQNFGWENNYEEYHHSGDYDEIGTFCFEKSEYNSVFEAFI